MKQNIKLHSEEWFKECFKDCKATNKAKTASINMCKKFNINGVCDAAYIANVICFKDKLNLEKNTPFYIMNRLYFCYETNISKYKTGTTEEAKQFILKELKAVA